MFLIYDESLWSLLAPLWMFHKNYWHQPLILAACFELLLFSLTGLLAIWGGLGRGHWFLRAMVVLAGLSLWTFVPAYEPMLVFFVQTTVAVPSLVWGRSRRANKRPRYRLQFTLRDMLLWTAVVAVISAAASRVTTDVWLECWKYAIHGTVYGLLTALAAWVALGRSRWPLRAIGGCSAFPTVIIVGWLLLGRLSGLFGGKAPAKAVFRHAARFGLVLLSLVLIVPSAILYHELVTPLPIPVVALPEPNGHDDLARAGEDFENVTVPERADGVDAIRKFVRKHAPALKIARTGMGRECELPLQYNWEDLSLADMQSFRNMSRAFRAEALLAEEENRTKDAIRSHCDNLRLGNATARGGLFIHRLVGMAIKSIGISGLNGMRDRLSARQCQDLIEIIEATHASWEPFEACLACEKVWADHAYGWRGRVGTLMESLCGQGMWAEGAVRNAICKNEACDRLLIAKLAIRCHQLERGRLPDTLTELVPEFLPRVPQDPYSGKPLIYRRDGDECVLYSVGPDGVDDGGQPATSEDESWEDKDLFLYTWPDEAADSTSDEPEA